MKKILLLGATGSVGTSVLCVLRRFPKDFQLEGVAVHSNITFLLKIIQEQKPEMAVVFDEEKGKELSSKSLGKIKVMIGEAGLIEMVENSEAKEVILAMSGTSALAPALRAIELGKNLILANKEVLVMSGDLIMKSAKKHNVKILPIDSEHNALFQCLQGVQNISSEVKRLVLTASGGPFRLFPLEDFPKITVEQALNHPQWKMGKKISIDSATLFNKGLEMIEAHWLFSLPIEKIDIMVHPQSRVHSLVEFVDGNILVHCAVSNMQIPIQHMLFYPQKREVPPNFRFPLQDLSSLDFELPKEKKFPSLNLCRKSIEVGGSLPAVLNQANEVAVHSFLRGELKFHQIFEVVEKMMSLHQPQFDCDLQTYQQIADLVSKQTKEWIQNLNE